MDVNFEPITESNVSEYAAHKREVVVKSGVDGSPIYNPYSQEELQDWHCDRNKSSWYEKTD